VAVAVAEFSGWDLFKPVAARGPHRVDHRRTGDRDAEVSGCIAEWSHFHVVTRDPRRFYGLRAVSLGSSTCSGDSAP
jgi:hypothetical protein